MPPQTEPRRPVHEDSQEQNPSTPAADPGTTCWRLERANRVALIVDAAAYYAAVKAAMLKARHSIILLGWDFDTRVEAGEGPRRCDRAEPAGPFLERLVADCPGLRSTVLKWDFAMIFALDARSSRPR